MLLLAAPALVLAAPVDDDAERWQRTLERVTPSIVTLRTDRPRGFEGVGRGNSQATGFVVDAELGLILTNRHVVTGGPVVAEAVFQDNEVLDLVPVYRDPIHDFGLFRYDPAALRHVRPVSLPLDPAGARVGVQIRVVGNDSGEQLSILDGTLSRTDRPAPVYGGGYSDVDTFYVQAASATSGGSSGSPVLDVDGHVVALNAGAKTTTATAFYLPLDRVVRALELVRAGQPVPRGTWLTRSEITPYDELRRLGLTREREDEARARRPQGSGLLVVREVLPGGPADGRLQIGDILWRVGDRPIADFVTLEALLDDHVGAELPVTVLRRGAEVEATVAVADLHAAVPSRMLDIGGSTLHDLSFHQARAAQIELDGVYLADAGRSWTQGGVPDGAVIREIDGAAIHTLDDAVTALSAVADDRTFVVRWHPSARPTQGRESTVRMDRSFWPARTCDRADPGVGTAPTDEAWRCEDLPAAPEPSEPPPTAELPLPPVDGRVARRFQHALVGVVTEVPLSTGGLLAHEFSGAGVVVDAERGWILVDRDTVPSGISRVRVLLGGATEVPAEIVALHEIHGLAVIRVDPAAVPFPLEAVVLSDRAPSQGDRRTWVGLDRDGAVLVEPVVFADQGPFELGVDGPPRFRETNVDVYRVEEKPTGRNGVIVDRRGRVEAFWASESFDEDDKPVSTWQGLPADAVRQVLALAEGDRSLRELAWELDSVPLPRALERGLPPGEARRLVEHEPTRRAVLEVERMERGSTLSQQLRVGDLLLAVDGAYVTRCLEVEAALRGKDRVTLTVARNGRVESVEVTPDPVGAWDVDRVVKWAGLHVQAPERSARLLGAPAGRPYVVWREGGSPAGRAGLYAMHAVLAVDGQDVPDLATFERVVAGLPPDRAVRVDVVDLQGERKVLTVKPDERFFPPVVVTRTREGWRTAPLR